MIDRTKALKAFDNYLSSMNQQEKETYLKENGFVYKKTFSKPKMVILKYPDGRYYSHGKIKPLSVNRYKQKKAAR